MRKGGGKGKGNSFERFMSKELSLWVSNGIRKDLFWRTHSSGAIGTVSKVAGESGDIMAIDDLGRALTKKYNIECRHSKSIHASHLIYGDANAGFQKFIAEGVEHSKLGNKKLLGFVKQNRTPVLVVMEWENWMDWGLVNVLYKGVWAIIQWDIFKSKLRPERLYGI